MRAPLFGLVALLCLVTSADAERRIFIVANDADGYGVDRCLAAGEKCGTAAANAYCKTQSFAQATTFHKAGRDDTTGSIPAERSDSCHDDRCEAVAIICAR